MSTLGSGSTLADVQAAYDDNASYAEDQSLDKARAFVTAARMLMRRIPQESSTRDGGVRFQMELIQQQITDANQWIAAYAASAASNPNSPPQFTRISTQRFLR